MEFPRLDDLPERLGIALRDPELLRQAFVHSSYFNENPHAISGHNERLEFLGDAVIGVLVSRHLFERFPDDDEGLLTARRASLVNRDALADSARVTSVSSGPPFAAGLEADRLQQVGRDFLERPCRG